MVCLHYNWHVQALGSEEMQLLHEKIKQLEREKKRAERRIRELQQKNENFEGNLKMLFNEDQLASLTRTSNRGSKWSEATIKKALQLHFSCGTTGYSNLLEQKLPYPSARTLRRRVEGKALNDCCHQSFLLLLLVSLWHVFSIQLMHLFVYSHCLRD